MLEIQIGSESVPGLNIPLAQRLMLLLSRVAAMGLLPQDRITAIDAEAVRRVLGALQREKLVSTAAIELAPLLRTNAADLDAATAQRMERAVDQLTDALAQSPAPASEWTAMREVFGDEALARLVAVSESSLRRYAAASRSTPQDVAERLHWLAMVVADLKGAYNDFGIRRWFERPRPQLDGHSPRSALGSAWHVDDAAAAKVRALSAALSGPQPLAA